MSAIQQATLETKTRVTGEELAAMGDMGPSELIEGEIIYMPPTGDEHGIFEFNIGGEIRAFVRKHKLGYVSGGEVGIYIRRNPDTVRAADVAFISNERYAKRGMSVYLDVAPDLIVEIMSPADRWSEVMKKMEEYFAIGVRLVLVVEPDTKSVYAYRSLTDVQRFKKGATLSFQDILPGFSMAVEEIFAK